MYLAPFGIARSEPPIPTGTIGHAGLHGDVGGTVEQRLHDRAALALALREQHQRLASLQHRDAPPQCLSVGGAAADREAAQRGQQPAECLVLPVLVGAHEPHAAMRHRRSDRGVEDAAMRRGQQERPRCRHVLRPSMVIRHHVRQNDVTMKRTIW